MVTRNLKILQHLPQDVETVFAYFGMFCIDGLKDQYFYQFMFAKYFFIAKLL